MLPLIDRGCHHWMLPLFEINVHQVGMLPLVERYFHHWMLTLVERNFRQVLPIVDSGYQSLPLVDSGDQMPMDPSKQFFIPLVDRYGWKVLRVWLTYQYD